MNILQNIQNMLGQSAGTQQSSNPLGGLKDLFNTNTNGQSLSHIFNSSSGILGPSALGGLAGALLSSPTARSIAGGALLAGGGATLWEKYKNRIKQENKNNPNYQSAPSTDQERAERLIRALVFAAKSDGHIDATEQQKIQAHIRQLNLGNGTERLVQEAINEPLDPMLIARGVKSEEEALEIFTLSCAVIDVDHFMERSYLDALANALNIPDDVKQDLEANIKMPQPQEA